MKGLRHNVIEINHTENKDIDRILVFLKPGAQNVALATTRAEANELLKDLEVKKPPRFSRKQMLIAAGVAAGIFILFFTLLIV